MLTDKSIKKCKFLGTNIDHTEGKKNMENTQTNKETYKWAKAQTKKQAMQQTECLCIVLIKGNEKKLMIFTAVSTKTLKTVKY